jgi:hypothetical protein
MDGDIGSGECFGLVRFTPGGISDDKSTAAGAQGSGGA